MLTQHIALVPETDGVSASDLARVSAALQKQVTRDLTPAWAVSATVDAFPRLEEVPVGYWPIVVSLCELGRESGVHLDENGQPYAQVEATRDSLGWSLAASRACLDMLVNPYGDRTVTAASMRSQQGLVEYALDVAGPCAGPHHTYSVNDVVVSDFCMPAFFGDNASTDATRYSFCGALTTPFQLRPGGHLIWLDPVSNSWWLRNYWDDIPIDVKLGTIERRLVSVRELVRAHQPLVKEHALAGLEEQARLNRRSALGASQARAHRLRALLGARLDSQAIMELDASEDTEEGAEEQEEQQPMWSEPAQTLSIVVEPETQTLVARPRLRVPEMDGDDELEQLIETLYETRPEPRAQTEASSQAKVCAPRSTQESLAIEALSRDRTPSPALRPGSGTPSGTSPATSPATPPARSAHASFAPVDVPSFGDPPGAGRRLGLIFSATAGALLVLLAWGGQAPIVRSAASARVTPDAQAAARTRSPAARPAPPPGAALSTITPPLLPPVAEVPGSGPANAATAGLPSAANTAPVPVVTALGTSPVPSVAATPSPVAVEAAKTAQPVALSHEDHAEQRRRHRRRSSATSGTVPRTPRSAQREAALDDLVNTRR